MADTVWTGLGLFLLFRYVAAHLGVAAIGAWSLLAATMSITAIADVGVGRALLHFVPTAIARGERNDAALYVKTAVVAVGALFIVVLAIAAPVLILVLSKTVSPEERSTVLAIMPLALVSFWISNIALVYLSGVAGMQRYDLKSLISMAGTTVQLLLAYLLIPRLGLIGLAWAQIGQSATLTLLAVLLLRRILPELGPVPLAFSGSHFRAMRKYGVSLQLYNLAAFVFEPTTKFLLSHFGGLATVGLYEIASRLISQVRSLVVNAIQVMVPALAGVYGQDADRAFDTYQKMVRMIWVLALPTMATIAIFLPAISDWWLGRIEPTFVLYARILLVAWTLNLVCSPAFFMALASGRLKWNLRGTALGSLLNLLLGPLLGAIFGPTGVVLSASVSLATLSLTILICNHLNFGGKVVQLADWPTLRMGVLLLSAIVVANWLVAHLGIRAGSGGGIALCAVILVSGAFLALHRHPAFPAASNLIRERLWPAR